MAAAQRAVVLEMVGLDGTDVPVRLLSEKQRRNESQVDDRC